MCDCLSSRLHCCWQCCLHLSAWHPAAPLILQHCPCLTISCAAAVQAFKAFGLPEPIAVPAQAHPDPEFPTVELPNPEEGRGVWNAAYQQAEATGATLVLANDPDADRFSASEWDAQAGEQFTDASFIPLLAQATGYDSFARSSSVLAAHLHHV